MIGPYRVLAKLGEGGMGEVYRARDSVLGREVAIKVLPDPVAQDHERLARFEREARTLASLNHPNIAQIYGVAEGQLEAPASAAPTGSRVRALVMELVEGPTLAERIEHGAIPLDEALAIARQIAEALEAAHEQGIVHRDLKPANIKVRPDGAVKVLDFGLAKALEPVGAASAASLSPTITSPAMTQTGMLLGTAAYMSPEQAKGRQADRRSDLWAFGCVLYEMLTGTRAFGGEDVTDALAFVITREPDWTPLPAGTPPAIRRLLRRALEKDRRRRLADAADARIEIEDAAIAQAAETVAVAAMTQTRPRWRVAVVLVAALALTAGAAAFVVWWLMRPLPPRVTRLTVAPAASAALSLTGTERDLAIAPDGSGVVYVGNNATQLFWRPMNRVESVLLVSTKAGSLQGPFFSPDGQWVGFADEAGIRLAKVPIAGGPPLPVYRMDGASRGATWGPDGTIVFATASTSSGLMRVSEAGGRAEVLTRPAPQNGEIDHQWPCFLPGGRHVLFTIQGKGRTQVNLLDLETGRHDIVIPNGSSARYVDTGHLVFAVGGALFAVSFDLDTLTTSGTATLVGSAEQGIFSSASSATGLVDFDVTRDGTLVYVPAGFRRGTRTVVWVNRNSREEPLEGEVPERVYLYPRLSADETSIALDTRDEESDIQVWDTARKALQRVTFDPSPDRFPVLSRTGRGLFFTSFRYGSSNLAWQSLDSPGTVVRLTESPNTQFPTSIAPGDALVFYENVPSPSGEISSDVMLLTLEYDQNGTPKRRDIVPLVQTGYDERNGEVSPDGRWLAYESNSSGQTEVYVKRFRSSGDEFWQVSTGGGLQPLWARNGRALFFRVANSLMSHPVEPGDKWIIARPTPVLTGLNAFYLGGGGGRTYDVGRDGRFLMIKQAGAAADAPPATITVVSNWAEELKRLAAAQ
jgi:serine/threonine-protein kinase